ncbi:MAG: hypothetical protein OIF57_02685 [Marinobacterium sp.]|nr:hypothetical protein [Marinobacterium sp.]
MNQTTFTGVAADDRRIAAELQAMGAFDQPEIHEPSAINRMFEPVTQFLTWMRWKGEYGVYGCRVGATEAYRIETQRV